MNDLFDDDAVYRISDLIAALEKAKADHGDLPLSRNGWRGGVAPCREIPAKVKYIKLPEKRERILSYWGGGNSATRGEKVMDIG
ncbi:hypothetical protein [Uruburuella suis]|jgi:hypothetical protein|uniref:hypothetical protein n=1 Tax=Uruburuella suis TaxID=252130 RepID=UPI001B634DF7|nr:hypothetical protein [Uruburuella suis]MBP8875976.1 hypothetical protein [Neisseria sp.]